jgi:hypothetical protein
MKPISFCGLIAALTAGLLICPLAHAQSGLSGTTLGRSQNSPEDLVNSLVPGPKHYGKNEKKEEVDPKKLPSKTIHDKTFQGNLMDIGVDWNGDKLGKPTAAGNGSQGANSTAGGREPLANGPREADDSVSGKPSESKTVKSTDTDSEKDPKAAAKQTDPASDKGKASKHADAANDAKKEKAATVSSDEKSSDANKAATDKTNGDH